MESMDLLQKDLIVSVEQDYQELLYLMLEVKWSHYQEQEVLDFGLSNHYLLVGQKKYQFKMVSQLVGQQ